MSQLIKRITKKGFTLIELMIVVAIIGILAAIAIPKFADLITKSREASVKGSLGSIRGAVTIYYSDQEGAYPTTAANLVPALTLGGKYIDVIPAIAIPRNSNGNPGHNGASQNAVPASGAVTDAGAWVYVSTANGEIRVDCTHVDTKSSIWSSW
jgi:prepilin-type N-terminal cleavage/methylation domain-containing protein